MHFVHVPLYLSGARTARLIVYHETEDSHHQHDYDYR